MTTANDICLISANFVRMIVLAAIVTLGGVLYAQPVVQVSVDGSAFQISQSDRAEVAPATTNFQRAIRGNVFEGGGGCAATETGSAPKLLLVLALLAEALFLIRIGMFRVRE